MFMRMSKFYYEISLRSATVYAKVIQVQEIRYTRGTPWGKLITTEGKWILLEWKSVEIVMAKAG